MLLVLSFVNTVPLLKRSLLVAVVVQWKLSPLPVLNVVLRVRPKRPRLRLLPVVLLALKKRRTSRTKMKLRRSRAVVLPRSK
jgi:hypothetical protein